MCLLFGARKPINPSKFLTNLKRCNLIPGFSKQLQYICVGVFFLCIVCAKETTGTAALISIINSIIVYVLHCTQPQCTHKSSSHLKFTFPSTFLMNSKIKIVSVEF